MAPSPRSVVLAATIAPADGASLTLVRHGHLVAAAATDDIILGLDECPYDVAQGPCVDAATEGQRFQADSLEDEQRFLHSPPRERAGLPQHSVNASRHNRMDQWARSTCTHAAPAPSTSANSSWPPCSPRKRRPWPAMPELADLQQIVARLQAVLEARDVIAQAQGALMAQTGATADEAHTVLRKRSQATSTPRVDHARHVIDATQGSIRA